jgi:hypothetical protein
LVIQPMGNWVSSTASYCFRNSVVAKRSLIAAHCQTRPLKNAVFDWHGSICQWMLAWRCYQLTGFLFCYLCL